MATILKPRKPLHETFLAGINPPAKKNVVVAASSKNNEAILSATTISSTASQHSAHEDESITVEKYLEFQFEEMLQDFREHTQTLISKLREEYERTALEIHKAGETRSSDSLCTPVVTLKAIAGPHIGQKFRLELLNGSIEDEFKMGRSTGRLFKEKGVSLYKDKEISTTHAKIEFKNGGVFLIDMKSTNGTQLNEEDVEESVPYKLAEGDKITMGSTVLLVHLSSLPDDA